MMEYFNGIVTFISVLLGSGIIFFRETKRAKQLENESRQSEEWRKLYEDSREDSKAKEKRLEVELEKRVELHAKISGYERKLSHYEILYCKEVGCPKREPQLGSTINTFEYDTTKRASELQSGQH